MKHRTTALGTFTAAALAAAIAVLAAPAHADTAQPAASGASAPPQAAKKATDLLGHTQDVMAFVRAYDANGDDVLTQQEYDDFRRARFAETDLNKDGGIDMMEYIREFEERMDARIRQEMVQADRMTELRFVAMAGHDGRHITRAAFDQSGNAAYAAFEQGKLPEQPDAAERTNRGVLHMPTSHNREGMLALYDRNGDGKLPRAEYDAVRDEQFKASDSNGDGRISRGEYAAEYKHRLDQRIHEWKSRQLRQARVRFGIIDKNKDDRIDVAEYLAGGFGWLDRNGDGKLDAADAALPPPQRKASS